MGNDYLESCFREHGKKLKKLTEGKGWDPFVVFLCGPCKPKENACPNPAYELREYLKGVLEGAEFKVVRGEDDGLREIQLNPEVNAQDNELIFIEDYCQAVIIIASSPGSFCELGLFSWHIANKKGCLNNTNPKPKFFVLIDKQYKGHESYLNEGPVKSIESSGEAIYIDYENYDVSEIEEILKQLRYFQE